MPAPESIGLDEAYSVRTPDDSRRLYAKWASTYEQSFVKAHGYAYHEHVARIFAAADRPVGRVLDVGCGTGVVGVALRRNGVGEIDGVDISPEMLAEAARKDVYRELIVADLTVGLEIASDTYAGVTSAGTFTHGHLGPDSLEELIRVSRSGARCAIGVNAAHFEDMGFAAWFERAVERGLIGEFQIERVATYVTSDPSKLDDMANVVTFAVR